MKMDNKTILNGLWERYCRQKGSIDERIDSVMEEFLPTLPKKNQGEKRAGQYRSYLREAEQVYINEGEMAEAKGLAVGIPLSLPAGVAGARVGRVFGPVGMIAGAFLGGFGVGAGVIKYIEKTKSKHLEKVTNDYVNILDAMK